MNETKLCFFVSRWWFVATPCGREVILQKMVKFIETKLRINILQLAILMDLQAVFYMPDACCDSIRIFYKSMYFSTFKLKWNNFIYYVNSVLLKNTGYDPEYHVKPGVEFINNLQFLAHIVFLLKIQTNLIDSVLHPTG